MKRRRFLGASILATGCITSRVWAAPPLARSVLLPAQRPTPPQTPIHPVRIEQLGRVRIDDYAWLKPTNWKQVWRDPTRLDPAIRQWLQRENAYCSDVLAPTTSLQAEMVAQMRARTAPDPQTPAVPDGRWEYFTRYAGDAQHPRYLRRARGSDAEGHAAQTLLLDADARARGHAYFLVKNPAHSPDQTLFAWAEDDSGSEKFTIQVKDIATGALMPDPPTSAFGDFVFSPDSQWLFWVWRDAHSRPARLYRRPARGGTDTLVYEETDPGYLMEVLLSASREYIFVRCWNDVTSEIRIIDGRAPTASPLLVAPRRKGHIYELAHWRDRFIVRTNIDGAQDFKLMHTPVTHPAPEHWTPWIAEQRGHFITEMHPLMNDFAWLVRIEGNLHVMSAAIDASPREAVHFDEAAYALKVTPYEYHSTDLRLTYQTPRQPERWLACDLKTGRRRLLAQQSMPSGFDPDRYIVSRIHAAAPDGTPVPITVLRARTTPLDGSAPLLLTGYAAYGYSFETGFSIPLLSMIDRGWIWAVAHVRGGSEEGWSWFEQAVRFTKKTSFTDFIACAQTLADTGHSRAGRMVLHGFSAGGLLIGAALNMRPDLWGAAIGQAPFVDMLNTMSDASHPLVPLTRPVWGDPLHDPKAYDYIASYSPYDNVSAKPYPPVLATTAVADDRVGFWEPAKWIARLRAKSTSDAPMLLHTEMAGGHLGAAGRFDEYAQIARMYAFAIQSLAREGPEPD